MAEQNSDGSGRPPATAGAAGRARDVRRARYDARLELVAVASARAGDELSGAETLPDDAGDARRNVTLRAAVNDLQYRLLTADPQDDVRGFALERVRAAADADRVCAFANDTDELGRDVYVLAAEAVASPELSLLGDGEVRPVAYDDFVPRLFERLAAGEPFGARTEFLPHRACELLGAQDVEAVLLLPLFAGGSFSGFLRLDQCEDPRLWGEGETAVLLSAAGSISAAMERQQMVAKLLQRSHELAALLATSRSITSSIDYDVVLHEVACAAAEALSCPECGIWESVPGSGVAACRVAYRRDGLSELATVRVGETLALADHPGGETAVRAGVAGQRCARDAVPGEDGRVRTPSEAPGTRLSVPLVWLDEVLGLMVLVDAGRERRFAPDEVRMATVIGEQAAAAINNARLHRREEEQHRWFAALAEATRVIASRLDREELLKDVARIATQALLVDTAHVFEWEERYEAFASRAWAGPGAEPEAVAVESAVARALRRGELVLQAPDDPLSTQAAARRLATAGEQAVVWVPFRMNDETLGAMRLADRSRPRSWTDGELSFARALGEHAAIALHNARLYALIEDQATTDALTGLANRRTLHARLEGEIERARRYSLPLSLLLFDIDDFKKLNDTYGHQAGDEVLRTIGRILSREMRRGSDLAARYGGEEFCVVASNTTLAGEEGSSGTTTDGGDDAGRPGERGVPQPAGHREGAAAFAERLRRVIAETPFAIADGDAPVRVTVSMGVAASPAGTVDLDRLVAAADEALYAAKRAGKDCVVVGGGAGLDPGSGAQVSTGTTLVGPGSPAARPAAAERPSM